MLRLSTREEFAEILNDQKKYDKFLKETVFALWVKECIYHDTGALPKNIEELSGDFYDHPYTRYVQHILSHLAGVDDV
jgi:hypothetical protein